MCYRRFYYLNHTFKYDYSCIIDVLRFYLSEFIIFVRKAILIIQSNLSLS